jgi:hypothetical protein
MPTPAPYDFAVIQVVPYVERGECINAGIILYCRDRRYLAARVELDEARLAALAPRLDPAEARTQLALIPRICDGDGPLGRLSLTERFRWLVAPRSTVVQVSPVHSGLCEDPEATLEHLMQTMVRRVE